MKRTVKYALSAAMAAMFVVPALAQDNFPDAKEGHWATEALARMKAEGILVGYPNGMFIGGRLATRYEMAVAINAAYTKLKGLTDGLSKQIDDINGKITELQGRPTVSQADLDMLKSALSDLRDQMNGMKSYGQDIADLKRMAEKFEKDLASLGVDVDDMKKNLNSLDKRVSALEAHKLPLDIHGDINLFAANGYSTSHTYGLDVTGRPTGVGRGSRSGYTTGADEDFTLLHEVGFDVTTTNDKGPKGEVVAAIGNMLGGSVGHNLGGAFGSQSQLASGSPYNDGTESIYIQKAVARWDEGNYGVPFSGEVGRIGLKLGEYVLQRPDYTPYFSNERWDNGEWAVDGAKLGYNLGPVKIHVFAGQASDATDTNGTLIQPMLINTGSSPFGMAGGTSVNRVLGAHLWVPIGKEGSVDLSYVILGADNFFTPTGSAALADKINEYSVDAKYKFGVIKVWGGYSKTDAFMDTHSIVNKNDSRATGYGAYEGSNWGVSAGYKYIEPFYDAPGFWGRIGTWWNPTDIEGLDSAAHIDFAKAFSLKGTFEYYTGTGKVKGGLQTKDKVTRGTADLGYKLGSGLGLDLGLEDVIYDAPSIAPGGKPTQMWYNIGASYDFSDSTKFSILWQISDYESKGTGATFFGGTGLPFAGSGNNKGGLITTQFSIKI